MIKYIYDDFIDSIVISSKKKTDRVRGSVKIGDIILDLTSRGKVVGLEIKKFSAFLKSFKIQESIQGITSVDMSVTYKPDGIIIFIYVKFKKEEERLPIYISTELPQMAVA